MPASLMIKTFLILYSLLSPMLMWQSQSLAADAPRKRPSMDFGWRFSLGDTPGAERSDFNDSTWQPVDLPHDWSISGSFDENAPAGGGGAYLPTGIGWYRKTFTLPDSFRNRQIRIEFD